MWFSVFVSGKEEEGGRRKGKGRDGVVDSEVSGGLDVKFSFVELRRKMAYGRIFGAKSTPKT